MTTGFQQQSRTPVNFAFPKSAPLPHQVGRKVEKPREESLPAPREPRSFKSPAG